MRARIAACCLVGISVSLAPRALPAQTSTTGAVRGRVLDAGTSEPVAGATVIATSPALQGTAGELTDDTGEYYLAGLPPGVYRIAVYHGDAVFERAGVVVRVGKLARVDVRIDAAAAGGGETIEIEERAPLIDQGSTKTGVTLTPDYARHVPTGRTFGDALEVAPGAQVDAFGASFGGSTSPENVYIVEGINTTDPTFGLLTAALPNEFVGEVEIITGAYGAEFGRSTGGVVNVVTRAGSNELPAGMSVEAFLDVFNLFDQQIATQLDEIYTFVPVNPIVGGGAEDLAHLKQLDGTTGLTVNQSAPRNPNFGNPVAAQAPIAGRFGLRLRF